MLCGGQGNISVTANVAPRLMHELCVAAIGGDVKTAHGIQFRLMPLHKNLFVEANPIPVKWADGSVEPVWRYLAAPMTELTAPTSHWLKTPCVAVVLLSSQRDVL
jgi:4-hydroxy-tetrahydrodipicolinate synthase